MRVSIERGDALDLKADVLALKYAQTLHGVERFVVGRLSGDSTDFSDLLPRVSETRIIETKGKLGAKLVLLVGVKPLEEFEYQAIREFGRKVLISLFSEVPQTQHLALTLHGVGYGLDEKKAFEALIIGLSDAVMLDSHAHQLKRITIIEQNAARVMRLRNTLAEIIPDGLRRATIFGVCLGATRTSISYIDKDGQATIIPNIEGDRTTPSVVLFDGSKRIVGKLAQNCALAYPKQVVEFSYRHIGQKNWIYYYDGVEYNAEDITSYILHKVVNDAELFLGYKITDVVIACPSYFGINEHSAVIRAGEAVGLNVSGIVSEPVAAAIGYSLYKEEDQVVLIYDLGDVAFDVTLIDIQSGIINVIATGGDHHLGGQDWDEKVANYLAEQWKIHTGSDEEPLEHLKSIQDLLSSAEFAKRDLSYVIERKVLVIHAGHLATVTLTRKKFDELTAGLLERTLELTHSLFREAKRKGYDHIDQILLIGGSSRMPQVSVRLQKDFNIAPKVIDPDGVTKGTALFGKQLIINQNIVINQDYARRTRKADLLTEASKQIEFEQARQFFEHQLATIGLNKNNIEGQTPDQLEESLERVNDAIKVPQGFGTLKFKINGKGDLVVTSDSDYHYEIGVLPFLLETKKLLQERISLLRSNQKIESIGSHTDSSKIKILFLASNPLNTTRLRLDEEIRAIDYSLHQSKFRDKFDIRQHWAVRVIDLQSYLLRHKPDIVHFSGHGSKFSEIILEDNFGASHPVSIHALSKLFSILKDNIRCVVLNACYSEQQATAIAQYIDCVIGMSKAIEDSTAISFATSFYQALGYGRDVKTAFDLGCLQINLETLNVKDMPKLLTMTSNPAEIIFVH